MATRELASKVPSLGDRDVADVVSTVKASVSGEGATDGQRDVQTVACQNCGSQGRPADLPKRDVVADTRSFGDTVGIRLCDDCHAARERATASIIPCHAESYPVDEREVRLAHDETCQGCGITRHRLRLGGQDLELHPVVPVAAGGHRHEHNLVPLCSYCHRRAHEDD